MLQLRSVHMREAARLLAELAREAQAGDGFAQALTAREASGAGPADWARGPAPVRRPQPDRATGFVVHAAQPEGPERPIAAAGLAAYAARLAERVVIEGPVAAFSLRV